MSLPDDTLRQSLRQQLEEFLETNEGEKVRNSKWQIARQKVEYDTPPGSCPKSRAALRDLK